MTTDPPAPAAPSRPAKRRRSTWVLWYFASLVLLLLVGVVLFFSRRGAADEAIAAQRALNERELIRLAAVPRGRPALGAPTGEGKAATAESSWEELIHAITDALSRDARAALLLMHRVPPANDTDRAGLLALATDSRSVAALLQVAQRASKPPLDLAAAESGWLPTSSFPIQSIANTGQWIQAAQQAALDGGDPDLSLRLSVAACAAAVDLQWRWGFEQHLAASQLEGIGLSGIRDAIAAAPLEAEAIARTREALAALDRHRPPWADVVEREREMVRGELARKERPPLQGALQDLLSTRIARASALADLNGLMEKAQEALRTAEIDAAQGEQGKERLDAQIAGNALHRDWAGRLPNLVRSVSIRQGQRTRARAALALAAYRSEKGRLPERLEDLVPEFLPEVPKDLWTGKPLGWVRAYWGGTVGHVGSGPATAEAAARANTGAGVGVDDGSTGWWVPSRP